MTVGEIGALDTRAAVLAAIGEALHFPGYYGANLDALDECLDDLTWLPAGEVRLLWERDDVLAAADPAGHRAVLDVLGDAVARSAAGPRPLTVVTGST